MQAYANLGGDSGISSYEIGEGSIAVQFKDGSLYLYTDASAGSANISQMRALAAEGRGLNSYINRHVRKGYAQKLR